MFGLKREIDQIAKDKGIERSEIIRAIEEAMVQAARRDGGTIEKEIEAGVKHLREGYARGLSAADLFPGARPARTRTGRPRKRKGKR